MNLRKYPWNWTLGALAVLAGAGVMSIEVKPRHEVGDPSAEVHADAGQALVTLASWVPNKLPKPDPRQRKPPCRAGRSEEEFQGYCWIRIAAKPPCVQGEAFEHNGGCYLQPMEDGGVPTTGDTNPPPAIAD